MRIADLASSPRFNPSTNNGRGDWGLYDVSTGHVRIDPGWDRPYCVDHGAMNRVSPEGPFLYRCLICARACVNADA